MKISWGTGIWAFYGLFVAMILTLVGMSVTRKIDLVTDSYYEEELRFQTRIDKISNTKQLITPLQWEVQAADLKVIFPKEVNSVSGTVYFYCPSHNRKDFKVKIQPDARGIQVIPISKTTTGRFRVQFDWQANGVVYWNEGIINL